MNLSKKALPLSGLLYRRLSKKAKPQVKEVVTPKFAKLKEIQKKYTIHDDVPVYLKGGMTDRLLFQASVGLVLFGLGMSVHVFAKLIYRSLWPTESTSSN